MKTWLTVLCLSAPAPAAEAKTCDAFVTAFGKAGKLVNGNELPADDAAFWKKQCAKKDEAAVKRDTACLDQAKTKDDVGKCMK